MASVEVLLREDIDNLGRRGEIVRVKSGFARNFLLPRKLAMMATPASVKAIEQERKILHRREVTERAAAQSLAERLVTLTLEFNRKAGEQGVFYGSVTTHDIAHALAEHGIEIERRRIHLDNPIKQPGSYSAHIKLHHDISLEVPVVARAEGGDQVVTIDSEEGEKSGPAEPDTESLLPEPSEPTS